MNNLEASHKIGIEVNDVARKFATDSGIECYKDLSSIESASIDKIISNHVLEHVEAPMNVVQEFLRVLKPGGKVIIVVPWDLRRTKWKIRDVDNHLYSYSPLNIGNIFQNYGFNVISSKELAHKWPVGYKRIVKYFGMGVFNIISRINGWINPKRTQVKLIASKPE